jgi:hypothetical protein
MRLFDELHKRGYDFGGGTFGWLFLYFFIFSSTSCTVLYTLHGRKGADMHM